MRRLSWIGDGARFRNQNVDVLRTSRAVIIRTSQFVLLSDMAASCCMVHAIICVHIFWFIARYFINAVRQFRQYVQATWPSGVPDEDALEGDAAVYIDNMNVQLVSTEVEVKSSRELFTRAPDFALNLMDVKRFERHGPAW